MVNGEYAGGTFGWFSVFSVLCGIGLCLGYALLGACWLVRKRSGSARDVARRQIPVLACGVLLFLVLVFSHALIVPLADAAGLPDKAPVVDMLSFVPSKNAAPFRYLKSPSKAAATPPGTVIISRPRARKA